MPPLSLRNRNQAATLWAFAGYGADGEPNLSAAVEIAVRWEDQQTQMLDPQGTPVRVDAWVVVDREVDTGSILARGDPSYYLGTGSAETGELLEVVAYEELPDLKNRHQPLRVLGLRKYGGTLPDVS